VANESHDLSRLVEVNYKLLQLRFMPGFDFEGQRYQHPVELALHVIGGKWKMPILWRLIDRVWRYNELRRDLKRVSPRC
jgi:DNA-binding HxlR family transcriptional regulator